MPALGPLIYEPASDNDGESREIRDGTVRDLIVGKTKVVKARQSDRAPIPKLCPEADERRSTATLPGA